MNFRKVIGSDFLFGFSYPWAFILGRVFCAGVENSERLPSVVGETDLAERLAGSSHVRMRSTAVGAHRSVG